MVNRRIKNILNRLIKTILQSKDVNQHSDEGNREPYPAQNPLAESLQVNKHVLESIYDDCSDVIFRNFVISGTTPALLIYIDGLSNIEEINQHVLEPLMQERTGEQIDLQTILKRIVAVARVEEVQTYSDVIEYISVGNPVILIDRKNHGAAVGLAKWEKRSIEEPTAESVIRGPREGFTESISVNTSLLRRRIKSPRLKLHSMKIGRYTETQTVIAYIGSLADATLIEEVKNRLKRIDMDGVLDSGYIEEMIIDNPYSPFPQVLSTERPDTVTANLLEGRVAVLLEGTPFAMVVPATLYSMLQSADDYYHGFLISTAIRWLRYFTFMLALLLPSVYVAILTYHQEMVPTTLMLTILKSREEIPFPALVEALLMEVSFEALREAGIRLPKQVGAAVSIVGALVIGQAATAAGLVSAPMVMVVALTGIASFTIPRYSAGVALRLLRFPIMLLAGTLGFLGIMLALIAILLHLCSLRSFGVPYLQPIAPMKFNEMKDTLLRAPWWSMNTRPRLTGSSNRQRQSYGNKPDPNKGRK